MQRRKAYDRRVLYTTQGETIREMWKEVVLSKATLSGLDIAIDKMVGILAICVGHVLINTKRW